MTKTAYDRAVDVFEALLSAPENAVHATPAQLIQSAGLPSSTGYRHVAALEAEGLLRRDATGVYLSGLSAIRTGLASYGLGHLAPLSQPILVQLRQSTQHTAFLAVSQDRTLAIGPHSVGRVTRHTTLVQRYHFETVPDLSTGAEIETGLRAFDAGIARRLNALVVPVEKTARAVVVLGLILNPGRGVPEPLRHALRHASAQIRDVLDEAR